MSRTTMPSQTSSRNSEPARIDMQVEGAIARFVLVNPDKFNAISISMWKQVDAALDTIAKDDAIRCLIFEGAGDRAFCAGADLSEKGQSDSAEDAVGHNPSYAILSRIQSFAKPTIAMISGYCLGAGVALAASCDLRVAGEGAKFSFPAARLGLAPEYSVIKRLADLTGPANAKRVLFVADRFAAEQALQLGLIDEMVPDADLISVTRALAAKIAANAPLTLAALKCAVEGGLGQSGDAPPPGYAALEHICMNSRDYTEGRRAFAEKRSPEFLGR
jgi:enoyl-CoA hydratase